MRDYQYDQIEREIAKRRNSELFTAEPPLARVNPIFTRRPYSCTNYTIREEENGGKLRGDH